MNQRTVLRAKLNVPRLAPDVMPRPHLLAQLERGLDGNLTLVTAPAGYGKSSLIALWLRNLTERPAPINGVIKVAWLALDAGDNDLLHFLSYLVAAIRTSYPYACPGVEALLGAPQTPTIESLADTLTNELAELPDRLVLVLDDLHRVDNPAIHAMLARFIDFIPPYVHCVLISRADPPMPLARWRARGQLQEIRLHDLSFSFDETASYLRQNLTEPSAELITAFHIQTEGWAVGLRLAALSLRKPNNAANFLSNLATNQNRYTIDFLMDEVLDSQPPAIQRFLLCTSILERFSADLCAAVVDEMNEVTATINLDYVASANLFLIDLGTPGAWYRYHHQFQSLLQSRLYARYDSETIALLHRRAGRWFAAQGEIDEALHHFIVIEDYAAAASVIEAQRLVVLNEQRYTALERWLGQIPVTVLARRPLLLLTQAWIDWFHNADERCFARVKATQQLLQSSPDTMPTLEPRIVQIEIDALMARFAPDLTTEARLALTHRAWTQIQDTLDAVPTNVLYSLASNFHILGEGQTALALIATVLDSPVDWTPGVRALLLFKRGLINHMSGRDTTADIAFRQALQLGHESSLHYIVSVSNYFLGVIAYERNDSIEAEHHFLAVLRIPLDLNYHDVVPTLYHLIRIFADHELTEQIEPWLEKLRLFGRVATIPYLLDEVTTLDAHQAFVRGDLEAALRWAQVAVPPSNTATDYGPLLQAEILIAAGLSAFFQKAAQILQKLHSRYRTSYDMHGLVSVLVLQALMWEKMGMRVEALAALDEAVQLGVPNGRIRTFLDQGEPMAQLLRVLAAARPGTQWVERLLGEFPHSSAPLVRYLPAALQKRTLIEPLSEREVAVLALLAQSYTNQEIARLLTISVNTVRNHTVNIYGKLGVENRRQAVAKAHSLGLLSNA